MRTPEKLGRIICAAGAAWVFTSCSPDQPKAVTKTPIVRTAPQTHDRTQEVLSLTHQEVKRLAETYPQDSIIRTVYLGNLADISPIFAGTLPVGIADPNVAYSRLRLGRAEYTPADRFSYLLNRDRSQKGYATLKKQEVAVYFSPLWLNSKNDAVKALVLEKEAYGLTLWEPLSKMALNTYLAQGKITKIDPGTTEAEIARTLTRQILIENPSIHKLYDYAGYLPILSKVGNLLASGDPQTGAELNYSNLAKIYQSAKLAGVKFTDLRAGSPEFMQTAFDPNGSWAKMILNPTIPGPALLR